MLDRLCGLETEYALRYHPLGADGQRESNAVLYERLIEHVKSRVPLAAAIFKDLGWFTANGGAVRLEANPFYLFVASAGLVEGATPECRGPRQLLRYQRAQDVLLSWAAAKSGGPDAEVTLVKHNRDSRGRPFGSHENYEATIASGRELLALRLGLALLLTPFIMLPIFALIPLFLALAILSVPVLIVCEQLKRPANATVVLERLLNWLGAACLLPFMFVAQACITPFFKVTAFRRVRRQLTAFLVSRPIIAGSGTVGADGRFGLSPRAGAVTSLCSSTAELSRPVFYFGHIWKGIVFGLMLEPRRYASLFRSRQRLQICIGDSNMTQMAEYLKVGTTLLVLDAIEGGELEDAPVVRHPLKALRTICADPDLQATVGLADGRRLSGIEIQRLYLEACRRYVERCPQAHPEAEEILGLWRLTLDALDEDPEQLVGKLDWVTKRYLLKSARDASVEARRKLDLRYHELSSQGYYLQLEAAGGSPMLVEPEDVISAIQTPPDDTPAATRGRLIREFAASPQDLTVDWYSVRIRSGPRSRLVRLGEDRS